MGSLGVKTIVLGAREPCGHGESVAGRERQCHCPLTPCNSFYLPLTPSCTKAIVCTPALLYSCTPEFLKSPLCFYQWPKQASQNKHQNGLFHTAAGAVSSAKTGGTAMRNSLSANMLTNKTSAGLAKLRPRQPHAGGACMWSRALRSQRPLTQARPCGRIPQAALAKRAGHLGEAVHGYGKAEFAGGHVWAGRNVDHAYKRTAPATFVLAHNVGYQRTASGAKQAGHGVGRVVVEKGPCAQS